MAEAFVVTGTLTSAQTVALDEALPLAPTKVRVVAEPLPSTPERPYRQVIDEIRARQRQRGHQPRSKEMVDASLRMERDSWE
jgi:hypothetical protein